MATKVLIYRINTLPALGLVIPGVGIICFADTELFSSFVYTDATTPLNYDTIPHRDPRTELQFWKAAGAAKPGASGATRSYLRIFRS